MVNGKRVEVCYNDDSLLPNVLQLGMHFQGLAAEKVRKENDAPQYVYAVHIKGKRVVKVVLPGQTSYTSLYWKMKDLIYGKSTILKVRRGSKNRNDETQRMVEAKEREL